MKDYTATVKRNKKIAENIYRMTLTLPEEAPKVRGGQFANLSVGKSALLLRRPFGICRTEGRDVDICYQVKGEGTAALAHAACGTALNVLLPLGNGFDVQKYRRIAVIGGGVGIFPLVAAVHGERDRQFFAYLGFRNRAAMCLTEEFEGCDSLVVTTDDGSYGIKGNAVDAFFESGVACDAVIACGPPVMLRALKRRLAESGTAVPCYVSLEERMGCGVGACLVCVCKRTDGGNARVCRDGPVFEIREVDL